MMKKVCVITATRSEYGLLRWIMEGIKADPELELQVIATGSHLSKEFGETYRFIEEDGFVIDEKVDMKLATESVYDITRSMGICSIGMTDALERLKPDMIVVLGDRYELLPIASVALVLRIPIAHISGGDVTEGAIDNEVRNVVSGLSSIHFPGIIDSANNLKRMLGTELNIFPVGEPGLDSFLNFQLMSREELAEQLGLDIQRAWCLVTLHSETKESLEYNVEMAHNLYEAMTRQNNMQFVITKANADFGGSQINAYWDSIKNPDVKVIASLGQLRYLSYMRQVECVVGNSSSGIVEAPFLGIPVINIGDRQKGRHICENVTCCNPTVESICEAFKRIPNLHNIDRFWGDGHTSERIISHIKAFLNGKA